MISNHSASWALFRQLYGGARSQREATAAA